MTGVSKTEKVLFFKCVSEQRTYSSLDIFFEQRWFLCLYLANRYKNLNEVAMNI